MRLILITILISLSTNVFCQNTIYKFQLDSITGGNKIRFADFSGKKILIVNTASLDSSNHQYEDMKSLNQFYKDSLVIIAIPVGNFGKEPGINSEITAAYSQSAGNRFPVAGKLSASGSDIHPLFIWLTNQSENGIANFKISKNYCKYLINSKGKLVGVFSSLLRPNSDVIMQAIRECK